MSAFGKIPGTIDWKDSVRLASTVNVDIATGGLIAVDGVATADANRVLLKDQTDPIENGVYLASAGSWHRSPDCGADALVNSGLGVRADEGTQAGKLYFLSTVDPIEVGVDALTFTEFISGGGGGQTDTVVGSNGITNTGDNVNATLTPTYGAAANTITEGDDARLSDARTPTGAAGGSLGSTYPNPTVIAIDETGGANLTIGAINDSEVLVRSGMSIVGATTVNVPTGNVLWVDAVNGNDGTAVSGQLDLPFLTIAAALAATASGDSVSVLPGTYVESGITVPAGVSLIGHGGFRVTTVGDPAAVGHILTLSDGSYLQGFAITVPTTASLAGVVHSAGTGTVYDVDLRGNGAAGSGDGIYKTGTGKLVGGNIRCSLGGMENILRVDAGVLALDDVHVPQSAGTINNMILTEGTGKFQGQGVNAGNSNLVDCIDVGGTSTCIIYSPNWFNVPIGGHVVTDGVTITIVGGRIDSIVASLLVDGGLTGVGTIITVSGTTIQPLFSFPAAAIGTMELNVTTHQESTSTRNAESRVLGADFVTGFPEVGSGVMVGEGSNYSDGIKVVTTNGSEVMMGSVVQGGNQQDVTASAQSRSASALTFQAVGSGNAIYFATSRTTPASVALKHWGVLINQIVAGVGGSYVMEIWDGATWVDVGVQASSQVETYRYSSDVFLRAASNEFLQYGIDDDTTWGLATVDDVGSIIGPSYWVRWRIDTAVTTRPTFELAWLTPSFVSLNDLGRRRALGLALWRKTLIMGGNVFGESGGVQSGNIAIGSGGLPTGWDHNAKNSKLNNTGDAIYTQLVLPDGLCTAFPLEITVVYSVVGTQPVTAAPMGIVSMLPVQVEGVDVADPAGGLAPIPRTLANTELLTVKAGQAAGPTALTDTMVTTDNKALSTVFGDFDINGFYEGDLVFIRFELDNDGTPNQDVTVWTIILNGVVFSDGGTL